MGISGLTKFLKHAAPKAFKERCIQDYSNKVLVYDTLNSLYKFCIALSGKQIDNSNEQLSPHLKMIMDISRSCSLYGITPIHIFDGKSPSLKRKTIEQRALRAKNADDDLNEATSDEDKIRYIKKSFRISPQMIPECKKLLEYIGLPYVQAPEEADSQCAAIVRSDANAINYVVSDDLGDNLAFGAKYVLRNFSRKKTIQEVSLDKILSTLGISHGHFVDVCILSSTDYCVTIKGIKAASGYSTIKEVLNNENSYQVNVNSSIPGLDILCESLKCQEYRNRIWPGESNSVQETENHGLTEDKLVNTYLQKLMNDDRFKIMFKVVFKLSAIINKKDSKPKHEIPPTFLSEYIDTKLYYTETAVVKDPIQINKLWEERDVQYKQNSQNKPTIWLSPQYNEVRDFLVGRNVNESEVNNYTSTIRRYYPSVINHNVTQNGTEYSNVGFVSSVRNDRYNRQWRNTRSVEASDTVDASTANITNTVDTADAADTVTSNTENKDTNSVPNDTTASNTVTAVITNIKADAKVLSMIPSVLAIPKLRKHMPSAYAYTHKRICRMGKKPYNDELPFHNQSQQLVSVNS